MRALCHVQDEDLVSFRLASVGGLHGQVIRERAGSTLRVAILATLVFASQSSSSSSLRSMNLRLVVPFET